MADLVPGLSRSRAAGLIREGAVQVNGREITRPAARVPAGARVEVEVPPARPDVAVPQDLPLNIVYEDVDLVVIHKAAGMVVHPAAGHPDGTLVNALLHHISDLSGIGGVLRPGIVHRLDRGTSGLMVVAKHDAAHAHLAAQFAAHTAGRRYLAICHGVPRRPAGDVSSHLARHSKDRRRMASTDGTWGRRARTFWRRLDEARTLSLIECRLETGRTHQVRAHLSESGWPLVGDPTYRPRKQRVSKWLAAVIVPDRPMLHAWRLALDHPAHGRRVVFEAHPPADFMGLMEASGLRWTPSAWPDVEADAV